MHPTLQQLRPKINQGSPDSFEFSNLLEYAVQRLTYDHTAFRQAVALQEYCHGIVTVSPTSTTPGSGTAISTG
eukprot:3795085-Rhodomonas_salina.2